MTLTDDVGGVVSRQQKIVRAIATTAAQYTMVLKLYGFPFSTASRLVATVLIEKRVAFEFIVVDLLKGEHKTAEFREKQPFGQVPYIDDDGFILYESRAICRYIEAKYPSQGTRLIPTDPKEIALFEQGVSIEGFSYHYLAGGISWEKKYAVMFGATPDENRAKSLCAQFAANMDVYEVILGKQKYIGGNEISLADLFHIPYGSTVTAADINVDEFSSRPNVNRWWKEITSRPSWQAVKDGIKEGLHEV